MSETYQAPDQETSRKARVKFGPGADQTVPHTWAEAMLTHLAKAKPAEFGRLLQLAAIGQAPATPGRKPSGNVT